jgi:cytochrome c553
MESSSYDAKQRAGGRLSPCTRGLLAVFLSLGATAGAMASSDAYVDPQAEVWAAACLTCHSAPQAADQRHIPSLYGMQASRIEGQMRAYASGEKPGLLMQQLAKGYDAETLRRIALWFQNTPKE